MMRLFVIVHSNMFSRVAFCALYGLMWVVFFAIARIGFLLANWNESASAGLNNVFGSMIHGLRMDMSMAVYISIPVFLTVLISAWVTVLRSRKIYVFYTLCVLFPVLLLLFTDIGLYTSWQSRIDATFLRYMSNPREVWASISHLPVFWILLGFLLTFLLFSFCMRRYINRFAYLLQHPHRLTVQAILVVIWMGMMIIPLRGGFQLAPLNQSTVFFSNNHFSNLAAINAPWNFMHDVMHRQDESKNPFTYMEDAEAIRIADSIYAKPLANAADSLIEPVNVLLIVWESLTEKVVDLKYKGVEVTPGLNTLIREGVYFSNAYATGDRTDKGIVGILSGYPAQPTTSIVKIPAKAASLPMLSRDLNRAGYQTAYYYGGEPEFANMKSYLMEGAFARFVTIDDFDKKDHNSKWGAHDGVVMKRLLGDMQQVSAPFFYTWLTLSSHEPYETPVPARIEGGDHESRMLDVMHYTDSVVFAFINSCKQLPWWKNTLVVITGDHGHPLPKRTLRSDNFRIPILFTGGVILQPERREEVVSQNDIAASILHYAQLPSSSYRWSRNLFQPPYPNNAFFTFNNGFGFVSGDSVYLYDNVGKRLIEFNHLPGASALKVGKALQQISFRDYQQR